MNDHSSFTSLIIIWWSITRVWCKKKGVKFILLLCYKFVIKVHCSSFIFIHEDTPCAWNLSFKVWVYSILSIFCKLSTCYLYNNSSKGKTWLGKVLPVQKKKTASVKPRMRSSSCLWILFYPSQVSVALEEGWLFTWLSSPQERV